MAAPVSRISSERGFLQGPAPVLSPPLEVEPVSLAQDSGSESL